FSADETRIVTMGDAGIRLWSSRSGQPLSKWMAIGALLQGMVLAPDERALLAWSDKSVRIWNLATPPMSRGTNAIETQQGRTGTRLGSLGQVELISKDDWQHLRPRLHP